MCPAACLALALAVSTATPTAAQELPPGQVIADVRTAADPAQSYAVYLPQAYTPDRAWPVVLAFDPGGRGLTPVQRYRRAAERYGFIVAGSNNSRNSSSENDTAVVSMANDVLGRFRIDMRRVYMAGMSGGARVAMGAALASTGIAGVIASSAGFPDGNPRDAVPFAVFATAGTDDFNHLELRRLEAALTSPHRLVVFEGGHTWLPEDLAVEAVEWMEVQAIKRGIAPRDQAKLAQLFSARMRAADAFTSDKERFLALESIADDFDGLVDVASVRERAATIGRTAAVRDALRRDREADDHETEVILAIKGLEQQLASPADRDEALAELERRWRALSSDADAQEDSAARRLARRVLGLLTISASTEDADYRAVIREYGVRRGRAGV